VGGGTGWGGVGKKTRIGLRGASRTFQSPNNNGNVFGRGTPPPGKVAPVDGWSSALEEAYRKDEREGKLGCCFWKEKVLF